MAKVDTWMPIYWGDYAKDTGHLGAAQHGAYLMLIKHYWTQGEPLPIDDAQLWRIACADSLAHWRKIKGVVLAFFEERDGRLHHKRIEEEITKAEGNADRRAESAKRAAEARWGKEHARRNAPRNAPRMPAAMRGECAPPSPSPSPVHTGIYEGESLRDEPVDSLQEPARRAPLDPVGRSQAILPDWEPSEAVRERLRTSRPDLTDEMIARRTVEFHAWCASSAKTTFNPDATWLGFMVKTHAQPARNGRQQSADQEDSISAGIRESLARRHILAGG